MVGRDDVTVVIRHQLRCGNDRFLLNFLFGAELTVNVSLSVIVLKEKRESRNVKHSPAAVPLHLPDSHLGSPL